jgi:Zn-dependent M28 family amino/carboxypeptidase
MPCDRYVIVGAHYDHIGRLGGNIYPGADANASGTIAMLSIAEMFSYMKNMGKVYDSNIIFVAFDAKEEDMAGSQELWDMINYGRLKDPVSGRPVTRDKITLMVNIDQIGSTLSPLHEGRDDYMIMLGTHSLKHSKRKLLEECNRKSGIGMDIALDYYGSPNFTQLFYRLSDQKVFVDNRIPSVLFTSGITMNNNKTWDTVESLNMHVLQKRIYLMYLWIEEML